MSAYDPETIELLRNVLDEAWTALQPHHQRLSSKARMAQCILRYASLGERNPDRLRFRAIACTVQETAAA
jgi:hypothetical protein